jgi:hypothetical protein
MKFFCISQRIFGQLQITLVMERSRETRASGPETKNDSVGEDH